MQDQAESSTGSPGLWPTPCPPQGQPPVCTPLLFPNTAQDEVLQGHKDARASCLQRPHPPPPRPRQLGRRSLMWPLVPELSHRNVTQHPEEPGEGHEKHSWIHCHVSHAPGRLQTPFCIEVTHKWRRKTNQGKVETRALVAPAAARVTAQPRATHWGGSGASCGRHGAPAPRPSVPKGRPQGRVVGAQGRSGQARALGRGTQGFVEGGQARRPRAETKVLSALLLGTEGFQLRVPCPQSTAQSCGRECLWNWEQELEPERESSAPPQAHFQSSPPRRSYDNG